MRFPQTVCADMTYACAGYPMMIAVLVWCMVGVILVALIALFFIFLWPELNKALVM